MRNYRIDKPAIAALDSIEPGEYRPKDVYKILLENGISMGVDISAAKVATLVGRLPQWETNGLSGGGVRWIKRPVSAKSVITPGTLSGRTEERLAHLEAIVGRLATLHNIAFPELSL